MGNRKSFKLICILLFLLSAGGGVPTFGQERLRPIGSDHLNPNLDGMLLRHSVYGDRSIRSWGLVRSPRAGIVGTPGRKTHGVCNWSPAFTLQTAGDGHFGTVGKYVECLNGSVVHFFEEVQDRTELHLPNVRGSCNNRIPTAPHRPYTEGYLYPAGNPLNRRPEFPDVRAIFPRPGTPQTLNNGGVNQPGNYRGTTITSQTILMGGGVYYFDNDLELRANLLIRPAQPGNNLRTVIYISGRFIVHPGVRFVPEGYRDSFCTIPGDDACQIAVIVTSDRTVGGNSALCISGGHEADQFRAGFSPANRSAIVIGPCNTVVAGALIAPHGEIYVQAGATVHGQILANEVYFAWGFNSPDNPGDCPRACVAAGNDVSFCSFIMTTLGLTVTPTSFTRAQLCAEELRAAGVTVRLTERLAESAHRILVDYTVTTGGGLAIGDIRGPLAGTLEFRNPSGSELPSQTIALQIANNQTFQGGTINIVLSNPRVAPGTDPNAYVVTNLAGTHPITVAMQGTRQTPPAQPTFSQAANSPLEFHSGLNGLWAGQTVGTLTSTGATRYVITGTNAAWFEMGGPSSNTIMTRGTTGPDYEIATQRTARITVMAVNGNNLDCFQNSPTRDITINIFPRNDSAFVTRNVVENIDAGASVQIPVSRWFVSDGDTSLLTPSGANTQRNLQRVRAIAASVSPGDETGRWNSTTTPSNNGITTARGGVVTVSRTDVNAPIVTYNSAGTTELTDYFFIVARDSAAYGYTSGHFDRWIRVDINLSAPPAPNELDTILCKYRSLTIRIADISGLTSGITHTFATSPAPTSRLSANGVTVSITGGNLVYSTANININPPSPLIRSDGTIHDTITYTVRNAGGQTGIGQIVVVINPVKETPRGRDTTVTALRGSTTPITLNGNWEDWLGRSGATFQVVQTGAIATNPVSAGVSVNVTDRSAGVFAITVPTTHTTPFTFQYTIRDNSTTYSCTPGRDTVSVPITVTVNLQLPSGSEPIPANDSIIVNKGGTATTLWRGFTSIMDIAQESPNGLQPLRVSVDQNPTRGTLTLERDGRFSYTHDGGEYPFTDQFTYHVWTFNGEDSVRSINPGIISIFVNPLNTNAPALREKFGTLLANVTRNFTVVNSTDTDPDHQTILILDGAESSITTTVNGALATAPLVDVSRANNTEISFGYNNTVTPITTGFATAVVNFGVNDSVNYRHFYNSGGPGAAAVWADSAYNRFHVNAPHSNTLTLTVIQAQDFEMHTGELGTTSQLIVVPSGATVTNVLENIRPHLDNLGNWRLELGENTTNGTLQFNTTSGTATYTHTNSAGLTDRFTYHLIVTNPDETRDTSTGTVNIIISAREPRLDGDAYYQAIGNDGSFINRVTIPFDRDINPLQTEFVVTFDGSERRVVRRESGAAGNIAVLVLDTLGADHMPTNTTSGAMSVRVRHTSFDNAEQTISSVVDSTAPVVIAANYTRTLDPNGNDILVLTMSESSNISLGDSNLLPFGFALRDVNRPDRTPAYTVRFDGITSNGNEYTLVINNAYNDSISAGDSVFVNWRINDRGDTTDTTSSVSDIPFGNQQKISGNKRVPIEIRFTTRILSATYWDDFGVLSNGRTDDALDGFIDRISIDLGMRAEAPLAQRIAQALVLPASRGFTKGDVTPTETGFDLAVTEANAAWRDGRRVGEPRTSVASDELISITEITEGAITVEASSVTPFDSVAPVILRAYYRFSSDSPDTTLEVVFSEPVELRGRANTLPDSPYSFYSRNLNENYNMIFVNSDPVRGANNSHWIYNVASTSISFPVIGDSIWIMRGGHVYDLVGPGRGAEYTVRAPLIVGEYASEFQLWVVPQPLRLVNVRGRTEPDTLHSGLMQRYRIPEDQSRGVALILEARGPVALSPSNRGSMRIIDNIGNVVRENIDMAFDMITDGENAGSVVGVAVWDGKNDAGRFVGAASYLALIDVSVVFIDRDNPVTRQFRQIISVTAAGTNRGD